jgi:ABC-type uncharacterized transport system permease subunit
MSAAPIDLPRWADAGLVPLVSVAAAALLVAGLVVLGIGESPLEATALLLRGALGSAEGIGFTLYYTTNFIFTGLAVAVAFHAGLFNIGGEGQATIAGIFAALACLWLRPCPASCSCRWRSSRRRRAARSMASFPAGCRRGAAAMS